MLTARLSGFGWDDLYGANSSFGAGSDEYSSGAEYSSGVGSWRRELMLQEFTDVFGENNSFVARVPLARVHIDELGFDVGIGPYSPITSYPDGQNLQTYDFIKREVYEANYELWTVNRTWPHQYFFNDRPGAGGRSFDYIWTIYSAISNGLGVIAMFFTIPRHFKKMCSDDEDDGKGGMGLTGVTLPGKPRV